MELRGTKGTVYIEMGKWEVVPEKVTETLVPARTPLDRAYEKGYGSSKSYAMQGRLVTGKVDNMSHARNFLDCVKSRARCNCDILTGHRSTSATLIANIALKTRSFLEWDARRERFTNNEAANRYLRYEYRAPYKLG